MWQDIKSVVTAATNTLVSVFRTMEKTVKLVENEVDNLDEEQKLRLKEIAQKRLELTPES